MTHSKTGIQKCAGERHVRECNERNVAVAKRGASAAKATALLRDQGDRHSDLRRSRSVSRKGEAEKADRIGRVFPRAIARCRRPLKTSVLRACEVARLRSLGG